MGRLKSYEKNNHIKIIFFLLSILTFLLEDFQNIFVNLWLIVKQKLMGFVYNSVFVSFKFILKLFE